MKTLFFRGIRNLMLADRVLREHGVVTRVVPLPPAEATECGMSLVINDEDVVKTVEIVENLNLEMIIKKDK